MTSPEILDEILYFFSQLKVENWRYLAKYTVLRDVLGLYIDTREPCGVTMRPKIVRFETSRPLFDTIFVPGVPVANTPVRNQCSRAGLEL